MKAARPAKSLLCGPLAAPRIGAPSIAVAAPPPSRWSYFHSSSRLDARRKPRFNSVPAKQLGLVDEESIGNFANKHFPNLDKSEQHALSAKYSPEQYEAIKQSEASIDNKDLAIQARLRGDPYAFKYVEDFATIRPIVDKRVRENKEYDPNSKWMTPDEFGDDFIDWALKEAVPSQGDDKDTNREAQSKQSKTEVSDLAAWKYLTERSSMTGYGAGGDTVLAPAIPAKMPGSEGMYEGISAEDKELDPEGRYTETKKHTRLDIGTIMDFERTTKIIMTRYVSNQTRLGRVRSISVMALVGNGNGSIGIGEAKGVEPTIALAKAKLRAIKNMMPVRRYENRTIYGNVEAKVGACVVQLFARPPGFGLRVSHRIFEIARAAGISDLAAKMPRSRSGMNSVKATVMALQNQPDPEEIARGRGRKLVDARKVYYGGAVY